MSKLRATPVDYTVYVSISNTAPIEPKLLLCRGLLHPWVSLLLTAVKHSVLQEEKKILPIVWIFIHVFFSFLFGGVGGGRGLVGIELSFLVTTSLFCLLL